ncbi:MAG: tetratricopeptide repeat protein [Candidatus Aceula meridiana]|nr:tetratricopeptide repeat protein [Candidatus Aceula meridiana]
MKEKIKSSNLSNIFLASWHPYGWFALIGFSLFFKTLFFDVVHFDDEVWLYRYHWFFADWSNMIKIFLRSDVVTSFLYRPALAVTFMFDTHIYGTALWGYHLTNISFHIANTFLVFFLFQQLKYDRALAFSFSLIFLVHPAMTLAVGWIPGRTETVLGFFILSSFICYLNFIEKQDKKYLFAHLVLFVFALFSKETAIILPLVIGFYTYFIYEKDKGFPKPRWIIFVWAFLIFLWFSLRSYVLSGGEKVTLRNIIESVMINLPSFAIQLGKAIFPFNLSALPIIEDSTVSFGVAAFVFLILLLFLSPRKRTFRIFFGALWFLFFLLPSLAISLTFYEYRIYLPLIGLMIVLMETGPVQKLLVSKKRLVIFTFVIGGLFAAMTFQNSNMLRNPWDFWHAAVKTSPHLPVAHGNLGRTYEKMGYIEKAKESYFKALELFPSLQKIHCNLGSIYAREGKYKEAEKEFLAEIKFHPLNADAFSGLAFLRYRQGRNDEGRVLVKKAIAIDPNNLGAYLILLGDYGKERNIEKMKLCIEELKKRKVGLRFPNFPSFGEF